MHKSSSGAVYALKIHLVIVTKYRKKVIDKAVHIRLEEIFKNTCAKWECECLEFNTEKDHLHTLIDVNPKVAPCKLVNNLKTVSSRLIRKEFSDYLATYYRKPVFWSIGYAMNSCGGVTLDKIKDYIKNQDTPLQ